MEFSENFFRKEVRCDFEIPEMMKRAWAAAIEVLQVVADICDKNGLLYFVDAGTMLGAVRHQGFIPWDDDIDICLKREDYRKLIEILPRQLPYGFVMAGMYADSERLQEAAFVPHMRVIADEMQWNFNDYMRRFHGFPYQRIGIDIFPLDYIPQDEELVELQKVIISYGIQVLRCWDEYAEKGELEERISQMEALCAVTIPRDATTKNAIWKLIDSVSALYREDEAEEVSEYQFYLDDPKFHMKKEWYKEAVYLPFEQIQVPVPCEYDKVLKATYGDYMIPVKGESMHDYPFYGHMEDELVKQIRAVGFMGTVEEFCQKVSSGELRV